tara:strand:- start:394 stop:1950 length:1557 start_codon:yes stop_codon:yes gene_type:complete
MAIPFLSDIKLNGNQIKELVVDHKSGGHPTSGYHGQLIFRTDQNKVYVNTSTDSTSPTWSSIAGDITRINITAGNGLSGTDVDTTEGAHTQTLTVGAGQGIVASSNKTSVDIDTGTMAFSTNTDAAKIKVKDAGISATQLANNAVETAKILDDNVTLAKLAHQTANTVLKMNGSGVPTAGTVDTVNITDDAVDGDKIADDAINSEHITDGSVDNVHLANSSININGSDISLGGSVTTPNTDTLQNITNDTTDADRFVTFVTSATGAQTGKSQASFKFNPGLNGGTLYVPNIVVSGDSTISNETVKVVEDNTLQFEGAAGSNADTELNLTTATLTGGDKTVTLKNESGTVALTSDIKNATITISAGSGLVTGGAFGTNQATNETITIDHEDTSSQASVDNSGLNVIQDVGLDTFGHVTSLASVDLQSGIDGRITNREFSATLTPGGTSGQQGYVAKTSNTYTVYHALGTIDVICQVIETGSPYATAQVDVQRSSTNEVKVLFGQSVTNGDYKILITKIG